MARWQMALALLVAAVALHVFGIFGQIRHYRAVFSELSGRWRDADIGTGSAGGRIAASAIAIVVADEEGVVRALRLRQGAGSFADTFLPRDDLVGFSLPELRARAARARPMSPRRSEKRSMRSSKSAKRARRTRRRRR